MNRQRVPRRIRRASRLICIVTLALVAGACATPVVVRRASPREVHRELTSNVISTGELSPPTARLLRRLKLDEVFSEDPVGVLAEIHAGLFPRYETFRLFALAELSFYQAEQEKTRRQEHYLAAAVYAYAYLFPRAGETPPSSLDPRVRDAADIYNRALAKAFTSAETEEVVLRAGRYVLPFGEIEIQLPPEELVWAGYRLERFAPAADFKVRGLRNRYRRPGIGAPLVASLGPSDPAKASVSGNARVAPGTKVPMTAFLRLDGIHEAIGHGQARGTLELHSIDADPTITVDGREVPLEYEPSVAIGYGLEDSRIWDFELAGFFSGEVRPIQNPSQDDGLFTVFPYRPGRIPVVLVHGTFSSPARWAEMLNELLADPRTSNRYQFWFFTYNTGNPILYSASLLRRTLQGAVKDFDPEGKDPALRRMVVLGHSQGGLIARLMVIKSGTWFWDNLSTVPPEKLDVPSETRERLQRALIFDPLPFVNRTIFVATPHGGSTLAAGGPSRLIARFVKLPASLLTMGADVLTRSESTEVLRRFGRLPSSIDNMDPSSPFTRALTSIPIAEGVTPHSIIAVKDDERLEEAGDGVVEYQSAHIEGVASELIVRSGHSVQSHPEAIEEVRRILFLHATEACREGVLCVEAERHHGMGR